MAKGTTCNHERIEFVDSQTGGALPPERALVHIGPGEEQPTTIAQGVYFWHSASTLDGEWVIADTNWPDEGLQLVHIPRG